MNNEKIIEVKMDYNEFKNLFNKAIFERSKSDLLGKIAKYPERYVGLFRPTKPKGKIIQNLLQSHEIRFGDAFEILIERYLEEHKFAIRPKVFVGNDGKNLEVDQVFRKRNRVFFIEQKIRDDHDSTKKVGQISNFEKKIDAIQRQYPNAELRGFFYFVDDSFDKNKKYYEEKLPPLSESYGVRLDLLYGKELFEEFDMGDSWDEIVRYLERWKKQIPDLPNIDFDSDPQEIFAEIKNVEPAIYRKIFSNSDLVGLLGVLFPRRATLNLLAEFFTQQHQEHGRKIYETLHILCTETIRELE